MREIAHIRATMLGRFALQQTGMKEPRMVSLAGRSGRLWTLVAYLILHRDRASPLRSSSTFCGPTAAAAILPALCKITPAGHATPWLHWAFPTPRA